MYQYDTYDHRLVTDRVAQFRDQVRRRISGELTKEEFLSLCLQNGLYYQRYVYMLCAAIPYGHLHAKQLRMLSHIAAEHDRGYGHFNMRQNIQYNRIELEQMPDILAKLTSVGIHAIQTSGNCIHNITTDQFTDVALDEAIDARPLAEILCQQSTFIPEFAFLPRKSKIAVSASRDGCAVTQLHDIGVYAYEKDEQTLLRILIGSDMSCTLILGAIVKEDLPRQHMLSHTEAAAHAHSRYGHRDNGYKARIKILAKAIGAEEFACQVEEEWQHIKDSSPTITQTEFDRVAQLFAPSAYGGPADTDAAYEKALPENKASIRWVSRSVYPRRAPGYAAVTLSLKPGAALSSGDVTTERIALVVGWPEWLGFGEVRVTHKRNLTLPGMKKRDLLELWQLAKEHDMVTANTGLLTDVAVCPGGDFCLLTDVKSIPTTQAIQARFDDLDYVYDLGGLSLNAPGYINLCGHHHVGNIGILGVDRHEEGWYQVSLGGVQGNNSAIGKITGLSFKAGEMPDVVERIINTFATNRTEDERLINTYRCIDMAPFKERTCAHAEA